MSEIQLKEILDIVKATQTDVKDLTEVVHFIKDNALMREEALGFSTKDDLKGFATKDDLKNFATKDDLRDEIRETENRLMNHIDGFAKNQIEIRDEVRSINKRLVRVEKVVFP